VHDSLGTSFPPHHYKAFTARSDIRRRTEPQKIEETSFITRF
jgi:hypothetical protein